LERWFPEKPPAEMWWADPMAKDLEQKAEEPGQVEQELEKEAREPGQEGLGLDQEEPE